MKMQDAPKQKEKQAKPLSLYEFLQRFPDEKAAVAYFEKRRWNGRLVCPYCGSLDANETPKRKPMPFWCGECKSYFSVRTGTVMEESRLPLHKWLMAMYLMLVSRKGISSVQTAKMLKVCQKTAWFLNHRIRAAMDHRPQGVFTGEVEVDEAYVGGKITNMHKSKRPKKRGGTSGKAAVFGMRERESGEVRAVHVPRVSSAILHRTIYANVRHDTTIYSDDNSVYRGLALPHGIVAHTAGEYIKGQVHTNGIESFWAVLKRGHKGIYHKMSTKHLHRYVDEFARRFNTSRVDTVKCIGMTADAMLGKRLTYKALTRDPEEPERFQDRLE